MISHRQLVSLGIGAFASCVFAMLSLPSTSSAHDPMYPKIGFHFRLGVGGDLEGRGGSGSRQQRGMEPSYGGGVELEVPINTHFSLGGAFEAYGWTVGSAHDTYNVGLDFLLMPRLRIPFGAHPWHLEVYFGLPIGPTVSLPSARFSGAMASGELSTGLGFTGGGRVGFRLNVNDVVGLFTDVGPMIQFVSFPRDLGPNYELWHYQFVIRVGASFGVGA